MLGLLNLWMHLTVPWLNLTDDFYDWYVIVRTATFLKIESV